MKNVSPGRGKKKMNFDGNLDFSILSSDVTVYDDTTEAQLTKLMKIY